MSIDEQDATERARDEANRLRRERNSSGSSNARKVNDSTSGTDEPFDLEVAGKRCGLPRISQSNMILAFRKLGVTVRYDEFAEHELVAGLAGFGPRLDDAAINRLRLAIDERFQFRPDKDLFYDVVSDQARLNRFHPVRDYLGSLRWDGIERIDRWLITYGGADDTPFVRAVSRLVLVAAVRRVRNPGAKFDEMLILESKQGTEKSSALRTLAVRDEWFTDDLPLGTEPQRRIEATAGRWLVEAGELKGMSRTGVADLKADLSRQSDSARPPYGRKVRVVPRQFVIVGTTNEVDGYLKDSTGNRRFWPVRVKQFDLQGLRTDRDQLWAEAAHAEASGEAIRLAPDLYQAAAVEQEARRAEDPMLAMLSEALGDLTGKLRTVDAYRIVGIEAGKAAQAQMERLGVAMRELGWERTRRRFDGEPEYGYMKGTEAERKVRLYVQVDGIGLSAEVTVSRRRPDED